MTTAPTIPAFTAPRHPSRARNHAANGTTNGSACGFVMSATASTAAAGSDCPRTASMNAMRPNRT